MFVEGWRPSSIQLAVPDNVLFLNESTEINDPKLGIYFALSAILKKQGFSKDIIFFLYTIYYQIEILEHIIYVSRHSITNSFMHNIVKSAFMGEWKTYLTFERQDLFLNVNSVLFKKPFAAHFCVLTIEFKVEIADYSLHVEIYDDTSPVIRLRKFKWDIRTEIRFPCDPLNTLTLTRAAFSMGILAYLEKEFASFKDWRLEVEFATAYMDDYSMETKVATHDFWTEFK